MKHVLLYHLYPTSMMLLTVKLSTNKPSAKTHQRGQMDFVRGVTESQIISCFHCFAHVLCIQFSSDQCVVHTSITFLFSVSFFFRSFKWNKTVLIVRVCHFCKDHILRCIDPVCIVFLQIYFSFIQTHLRPAGLLRATTSTHVWSVDTCLGEAQFLTVYSIQSQCTMQSYRVIPLNSNLQLCDKSVIEFIYSQWTSLVMLSRYKRVKYFVNFFTNQRMLPCI